MNSIVEKGEIMKGLLTVLGSGVFLNQRLPALVFRPGYNQFRFLEFDQTLSEHFWSVLQNLARSSQDQHINLVVLEPDPVNYFFKNFKRYGALRFQANSGSTQYVDALEAGPADSPADSLLYNSEVIAWFPDSCRWLIWGERNRGVAVLSLRDNRSVAVEDIFRDAGLPNVSVAQAVMDFVSLNFGDADALQRFAQELERNYWCPKNARSSA